VTKGLEIHFVNPEMGWCTGFFVLVFFFRSRCSGILLGVVCTCKQV